MNNITKSWYKKWWGILIISASTLILIFLIATGFHILDLVKSIKSGYIPLNQLADSNLVSEAQKLAIGDNNNYWFGSANPKIIIVEFSDFACPYCQSSFSKIREISLKYNNYVKHIYRDYPLQENSITLSLAARCAGEQGLFWHMHDKLFQNQEVADQDQLLILASQIGADMTKFANCLNSKKYLPQIQKDFTEGKELGISGTPTWFINGYMVAGDIPYDIFIQIIEELIKK